jgi:hypothetical protein
VYVIAPAASNAPSAGFPQLSRTREIFRRFLEIQTLLGPQIEARGGRLRTGLYTARREPARGRRRPRPKLHRKTQLFVTREALETLVRDPRVQGVIADQMRFSARHGVTFDSEGLADPKVDLAPLFVPYLEAWRGLPADLAARSVLYMTVGSLNKDARGMMTDGEVLQVTAGAWAMWAVSDMWMLAGRPRGSRATRSSTACCRPTSSGSGAWAAGCAR